MGFIVAAGLPANKQIILHFSRSKSPLALFSKLIMFIEKRKFSHACVELVEPATRLPIIFQASHGLVNFFYRPTFLKYNLIVESYLVEVSPLEYISIWSFAVQKMGNDYGWLEIISIFTEKLLHIKNWAKDGEKTNICSELAARALKIAGLQMPESLDDLTPSQLREIVNKCAISDKIRRIV
jgi:hypothetical protein